MAYEKPTRASFTQLMELPSVILKASEEAGASDLTANILVNHGMMQMQLSVLVEIRDALDTLNEQMAERSKCDVVK